MVADRGAAEGDEHVGGQRRGVADRRFDRTKVVGDDAEIGRNAARDTDESGEAEAVRGDDLVRPRRG